MNIYEEAIEEMQNLHDGFSCDEKIVIEALTRAKKVEEIFDLVKLGNPNWLSNNNNREQIRILLKELKEMKWLHMMKQSIYMVKK